MAIKTLSEEKKRQQKLLIVLGIVVLAILIFLYFSVWNKGGGKVAVDVDNIPQETADVAGLSATVLEEKLKKVDLNIDFFNQTILPFLKLHGDLPVQKGITGRLNPFIP